MKSKSISLVLVGSALILAGCQSRNRPTASNSDSSPNPAGYAGGGVGGIIILPGGGGGMGAASGARAGTSPSGSTRGGFGSTGSSSVSVGS